MTMKMKLAAVGTVAVALLWSLPAHASTVSIALGSTSNVIAGPDSTGFLGGSGMTPAFPGNSATIFSPPLLGSPTLLSTQFQNASAPAGPFPATVDMFVTSINNTLSGPSFETTLTANSMPVGFTTEMKTWVNADNMPFAMQTLVGDQTFMGIGSTPQTSVQNGGAALTGDFSITQEIIVTANSAGSASSTIVVFSTPEPSALLLLGAGLLGLGFSLRRKHV